MTYAQMHDGFFRNTKVKRAGNMAGWMWVASIGHANENLTDGFIPIEALNELSELDSKPRLKLAAKLVEVGLWEKVDGGWMIHDFLKWNFTREQVLAKRAANLARVNKHRAGNGDGNARVMRYNDGDASRVNDGEQRGESAPSSEPPYLRTSEIRPPPTPPQQTEAMPPVQPPKADPVVVVQPPSPEPTDDAPRPAKKPLPAGVVENGERLFAIMGAASNRNLDAVRGDSRKRLDLFNRIAAYELTDAESHEIGRLCIEPRKVWPWARSGAFDHGVSLSFLVGSANEGGFNGDAFGQVVTLARKNLAAAAEKATRAAATPAAPARPLRPENTPGTPEYIAANERTRINAQSRIKAAVAAEESASAPASAVAR